MQKDSESRVYCLEFVVNVLVMRVTAAESPMKRIRGCDLALRKRRGRTRAWVREYAYA